MKEKLVLLIGLECGHDTHLSADTTVPLTKLVGMAMTCPSCKIGQRVLTARRRLCP